jgi:hypothetical protein
VSNGAIWRTWGQEWQRWDRHGARLSLEQVRGARRPARAEVGNGHGAWCEYVPAGGDDFAAIIVRFAADGVPLRVVHQAAGESPRRWRHLRDCDCALCSRV